MENSLTPTTNITNTTTSSTSESALIATNTPTKAIAKTSTSKKNTKVFGAIVAFVEDLWEGFGGSTKVTPLSLYHRLIQKMSFDNAVGIEKIIQGFAKFFENYRVVVVSDKLSDLPRDTKIHYGDNAKIYLDIQKYIYQADASTKNVIHQHLLTIAALIESDKARLDELEKRLKAAKLNENVAENKFVNNIMEKTKTAMEAIDPNETNPMSAVMTLFKSGLVQDMISGIQEGVETGNMNPEKLFGSLSTVVGQVMSQYKTGDKNGDKSGEKSEEITKEIEDRYKDLPS
jgi:hypothetical protein